MIPFILIDLSSQAEPVDKNQVELASLQSQVTDAQKDEDWEAVSKVALDLEEKQAELKDVDEAPTQCLSRFLQQHSMSW